MADNDMTLTGKTCLITGATSGIGLATARGLAARGAHVIAVARDPGRGAAAVADIRAHAWSSQVDLQIADLSQLDSVRKLADQVHGRYDKIDILINNAGVSKQTRQVTADGLETTFATNHLGPFLLTNLLLDPLRGSAPSRVVTVSSAVHKQVRSIPWDDLQGERSFNGLVAYNLSKLLNILFTAELARRLSGSGVTANCVNPGFVHSSLGRELTGGFAFFLKLSRPMQKSPEAGARTSIYLAQSPDVATVSGGYFQKCRQVKPGALAQDPQAAAQLWDVSERLSGLA
jgi:NAD(P)-dependent dehydrogenase (short-subunit alcohol dehydrogenase family)